MNKSRFPLVSDAQSQLHLGRTKIQHVFDRLLYTKTLAGKAFSRSAHKLAGAVEGDGHALRKIYVSRGNATLACEVEEATARWKKQNGSKRLPKYWLGHVRIAALKKRNVPVVVAPLPMKLVPPGSAPGVESSKAGSSWQLFMSVATNTNLPRKSSPGNTQGSLSQAHNVSTDGGKAWGNRCRSHSK